MINKLRKMLGLSPATDYKKLIAEGAIVLDVRTKGEYSQGHVKGSLNIPLDQLESGIQKLKNKETPIITCCASGMRSASAKSILKGKGYTQVYNGGSWTRVGQFAK